MKHSLWVQFYPVGESVQGAAAALAKIASFGLLEQGWEYGSGRPAAQREINAASTVAGLLDRAGAVNIDAFPAAGGDILVTGRLRDQDVEVLCSPGGAFDFLLEKDGKEVTYRDDLTADSIRSLIEANACHPKISYDYCIRTIMTLGKDVIAGPHSQVQMVYPLSTPIVQSHAPEAFAPTWINTTTRELPVIRPFSGRSKRRQSRVPLSA